MFLALENISETSVHLTNIAVIHFICCTSIQTPWEHHYLEQKRSDFTSPLSIPPPNASGYFRLQVCVALHEVEHTSVIKGVGSSDSAHCKGSANWSVVPPKVCTHVGLWRYWIFYHRGEAATNIAVWRLIARPPPPPPPQVKKKNWLVALMQMHGLLLQRVCFCVLQSHSTL